MCLRFAAKLEIVDKLTNDIYAQICNEESRFVTTTQSQKTEYQDFTTF